MNFTACTALDNEILNCRTHDLFASDDNFSFQISEFDWDAMRFHILNSNVEIFYSFTCYMIYMNHIYESYSLYDIDKILRQCHRRVEMQFACRSLNIVQHQTKRHGHCFGRIVSVATLVEVNLEYLQAP